MSFLKDLFNIFNNANCQYRLCRFNLIIYQSFMPNKAKNLYPRIKKVKIERNYIIIFSTREIYIFVLLIYILLIIKTFIDAK